MNKPRILFLHAMPTPYRQLLFALLSRRYDITFLFTEGRRWSYDNPLIRELHYKNFREFSLPGYRSDVAPGVGLELLLGRYDLVVGSVIASFPTHLSFPIVKILRRRKFVTFDEQWTWPKTVAGHFILPYVRYIARHADQNIVAGAKAATFFRTTLGVPDSQITVAYNSSEDLSMQLLDREQASSLRRQLNPDKSIVFLYFGRVISLKNLDCLIRAFAILEKKGRPVRLIICGDGPYRPYCQQLAQELEINRVAFLGKIPHDRAAYYFRLCDVFVFPGRFEGNQSLVNESWGMTLTEAMSVGKPVIGSTSVGASYDAIHEGKNGFIVAADNVFELETAMEKLLDGQTLTLFGNHSRTIYEQTFTAQRQAQLFSGGIERALQSENRLQRR